jgi:hypothetical protein
MITLHGNVFGDPITIKENITLVSSGNLYHSDTVQVLGPSYGGNSTSTRIYSFGDQFSGVTYKREICTGTNGQNMPYGISYSTAPANDCRRDFYVYNSPDPNEKNTVVLKTPQKRSGQSDSSGLDQNYFQSPIRINSPPVYDPNASGDKFKYWGYTIRRNTTDGFLDFEGNQKPPEFPPWNATAFRFFGSVYPSADNQFEMGNQWNRWSLIRGVTITQGDMVLTDKATGRELYLINEDEEFIYFKDVRSGREMMRLGRNGDLYIAGRIIQGTSRKITTSNRPKNKRFARSRKK